MHDGLNGRNEECSKDGDEKLKQTRRTRLGISIVEFSAALVFGLPLVMLIIYVALEANYYFTIKAKLNTAVNNAARALANNYAATGSTTDTVTPNIRIPHYVEPGAGMWSPPLFEKTTRPYTVQIAIHYPSAGFAGSDPPLMPFPSPDPLNLGANFSISSVATYPLP